MLAVTGAIALVLLTVVKKDRAVVALNQIFLRHDTIINLSGYGSIKNLRLKIENKDSVDEVFYISPASLNFLNDSTLVNSLALDLLSPEQKAIVLWKFVTNWTDHGHPEALVEHHYYSPALMVNGIEEGLCDKRSAALANLAEYAGIPARVYDLKKHVVTELFYNNAWHMFDADKGIFYRRQDGDIADVAYLNANPQVISAQTKNIEGWVPQWRNEDTRRALSPSNHVDNGYKIFAKDYSAALRILPGEKICFELVPINFFKWQWRKNVGKRESPRYVRTGLRTSDLRTGMLKEDAAGERIYDCQMPYPIKHIKVSSINAITPVMVYYSPDSIHWYLKGTLSQANDGLAFDAFDKDNFRFTFKYYLKFEGNISSENEALRIDTEFTFSEKVLLANPEKAFAIRFADCTTHNLNVKVSIVE